MQPKKIVIHPGFHKTGTATVQAVLRQNRALLRPYLRSILPGEIKSRLQGAHGYSVWRDPFTREKFRSRFRALLARQDQLRGPCLCISVENLSGHLSGRESLGDFSAAIALTKDMARITAKTVPNAEIQFYFSTRAAKPWLDSAYWEHVKSSSMTMHLDTFTTRFFPCWRIRPVFGQNRDKRAHRGQSSRRGLACALEPAPYPLWRAR